MAEKPYRFLFRMPEQLRARLVASAQEHGRSLNGELLHRLEQSLEREPSVPFAARFGAGLRSLTGAAAWSRGVPRIGVAVAVALTAVVAAVGVNTVGSQAPTRSYDLAPPNGAVVRVPFPALKRSSPVRVPASRSGTTG